MKDIAYYLQGIEDTWCVRKTAFAPDGEADDETIYTLSNGYLGVRGALELDGRTKDAATYIAGLYDKKEEPETVESRGYVKNKALTPAYAVVPDADLIELEADGVPFDFINSAVVDFRRTLDMKRGFVVNEYVLKNPAGKTVSVKTLSFLSRVHLHDVYTRVEIEPLDFCTKTTVRFKNRLCRTPKFIRRLKDYVSKTDLVAACERDGVCALEAEIFDTKERVFLRAQTLGAGTRYAIVTSDGIDEAFVFDAECDKTYAFEKRCDYYTSRDQTVPAFETIDTSQRFDENAAVWQKLWRAADVRVVGDDEVQAGLRWNIFNLLQLADPSNVDVSIAATGLHGQGYFGHAFWDTEIFMIPFYLATYPEEAKSLLLYRYNRLDKAREVARAEGCAGAKFPWTSAYTGADVTPPDWAASSKREIHIAGAVAYAMYNYYLHTGDDAFYRAYGIETVVETAEYYASRATLGADGKYHILDVTGPDEYNIHVNDNYYTNYLAVWNMNEAVSAMERLKVEDGAAYRRIAAATDYERAAERLQDVAARMAFPPARDGVLEQYDGFFKLKDTGGFARDAFGMPIDRKRVFDSGLQELKQPDIVMLFYLFPDAFPADVQKAAYRYYEKRCKHGSSLSPSIHCVTGLRNGFRDRAYGYLYLTAMLDLKNLHLDKNLYEGVHIACAGGTWAAAVYGFGGVSIRDGMLHIQNPSLPDKWSELSFSFLFRGTTFDVSVGREGYSVCADGDCTAVVDGTARALTKGETVRVGKGV